MAYILKRLGITVSVLFGVTIVVFFLIKLQPGNPYLAMMDPTASPEIMIQKLKNMGYYDPLWIQYFKWLGSCLTGDLGYSIRYKTPVSELIGNRLNKTVILSSAVFVVSSILAVTLGTLAAMKSGKILDKILSFFSFLGVSIPTFFCSLLAIKVFSYNLGVLPASGMVTAGSNYSGVLYLQDLFLHMIIPVLVFVLTQSASLFNYTRVAMSNILKEDFIRTARAKGLSKSTTIIRHGLKGALPIIITILCMRIPSLLSGAVIIETIFVWPGIGRLAYEAAIHNDYPLIMGITLVGGIIVTIMNLLSDVLCKIVDPRIE